MKLYFFFLYKMEELNYIQTNMGKVIWIVEHFGMHELKMSFSDFCRDFQFEVTKIAKSFTVFNVIHQSVFC